MPLRIRRITLIVAVVVLVGGAAIGTVLVVSDGGDSSASPAPETQPSHSASTTRPSTTVAPTTTTTTIRPAPPAPSGCAPRRSHRRVELGQRRAGARGVPAPPEEAALRSGQRRRRLRPGHRLRSLHGPEAFGAANRRPHRSDGEARARALQVHAGEAEVRAEPRRDQPRHAGAHRLQELAADPDHHHVDRKRRTLLRRHRRLPVRDHARRPLPLLLPPQGLGQREARQDVEPVLLQRWDRGARPRVGAVVSGIARVRAHPDGHRQLLPAARDQGRVGLRGRYRDAAGQRLRRSGPGHHHNRPKTTTTLPKHTKPPNSATPPRPLPVHARDDAAHDAPTTPKTTKPTTTQPKTTTSH